jgi:hypothetical protein
MTLFPIKPNIHQTLMRDCLPVRPLLADNLAETIPQDVWNATTSGHPEPGITELTISFA